ncbi:MAG TPA: ubiquinone/menaquinone biosynthesis methyltransferase [Candidatus Hydrogenedens sp.]|nr:ubiquinone/menaquinone biosynthesis methyltransferase [Candidatus Hydrogenedens sp.]
MKDVKQECIEKNYNKEHKLRQSGEIFRLFNRIAYRYDLTNHILSFGQDIYWRKKLIQQIDMSIEGKDFYLLDLATGTGEVLRSFRNIYPEQRCAVGIDFAVEMLKVGFEKYNYNRDRDFFVVMDILNLGIDSDSVDVVTMAFGIRNVSEISMALNEIFRVLKPGGQLLILEFGLPQKGLWRKAYLFYLRYILPCLGGALTGCFSSYHYLTETICKFPSHNRFLQILTEEGFVKTQWTEFNGGAVLLYSGYKPKNS